ncbi:MAG TPA: LD-carboxypeptidase [Kofleriaceae bacterium]|nr:LD-carboxypeptidase [Kofleriaceae bacterium]
MSQALRASTIVPPALRPGDTVAVCAPAGPVPEARLAKGVAILRARYRVSVGPGVLAATGYLAGDDQRRIDELNGLLRDPDVRAIACARGGYGIMRILPHLDAGALRADPKPIVGFSDVTALLMWAWSQAGVRGVHGPVVAQLGELGVDDHARLFEVLEHPDAPIELETSVIGVAGSVRGPLLGGNLSLLSHLVGTPYLPDLSGAVLLVEDIGERPYAIDRYLTHLGLAGILAGLAGMLVGDLVRCDESRAGFGPDALAVIDERLSQYQLAGRAGAPIGHGTRNRAFTLGTMVEL